MCGGSYVGRGMRHDVWRHAGGREFLGLDVAKMSPGARISAALSVLLPVGLSGGVSGRFRAFCVVDLHDLLLGRFPSVRAAHEWYSCSW